MFQNNANNIISLDSVVVVVMGSHPVCTPITFHVENLWKQTTSYEYLDGILINKRQIV